MEGEVLELHVVIASTECPASTLRAQHGILLCYDTTKKATLESVCKTKKEKIDSIEDKPPCLLVGLRSDLRHELWDKRSEDNKEILQRLSIAVEKNFA